MTEIGSRQEGQPANGYRERFESIGAFDRADLFPRIESDTDTGRQVGKQVGRQAGR